LYLSNAEKIEILGVSEDLIKEKTVVSEEVAQAMSLGCQKLFKTDISLSTTGVAPNSDEFESEIGTVFYSLELKILKKPSNCIFLI
jgi:nicotinamide-nucleotide amidase